MIDVSCAFTGHRPQKYPWGYDEGAPLCVALKRTLAEQIEVLADAGTTDFLSGMAQGADTWAALAVYNGERRGGTAATVRYARQKGRSLIVIDPGSLQVSMPQNMAAASDRPEKGGYK